MEAEIRPLSSFEYFAPASLGYVIALLGKYRTEARLLAGGTDLLVWMKKRTASPSVVVDINRVAELSFIEMKEGHLHIGAATKLNAIRESSLVQERVPLLADAIGSLATYAIRNRATIGGNLCSASPAADTAPPLLALNASVIFQGPDGERSVGLPEFFIGPAQTVKGPDEVLRELKIPCKKGHAAFLKLGRRKGFTLSIASAAAFAVITDGKFEDVRVAVGAVAPTPMRSKRAEEALRGKAVSEELMDKAEELVKEEIAPITDVRASEAYRREMAGVLVKRALMKVSAGEE